MKKFLLAISFALLTSFNAHAVLEDFVCPDGFVCPEDIMVEVEYWATRYGELDETQMMVYDVRYKNIYSIYECDGVCTQDFRKTTARDQVKTLVASVQQKVQQNNFDFSEDELSIYESIKSNRNFKWYDTKDKTGKLYPAADFVVYEYGRKNKFQEGAKFYNENRDFIAHQLHLHGLPAALEFLPFAESEYDPFVISPAACVGTWQLSKAAGVNNGLIISTSIDERRDPIKSTTAAMGYYTNARDCIDGTACQIDYNYSSSDVGPLLMLSYIYGVGGTLDAMKTLQSTNFMHIRNNYTGAKFGKDTKGYFSKFLGVYHVGMNQEKYFGQFGRLIKPDTQVLRLSKAIKTKPITASLELSVKELMYLPANMRYTNSVWYGSTPIPANNDFEIPSIEAPKVANIGTVVPAKKIIPREKIEYMQPRPAQPLSTNRPELKLAEPSKILVPSSAAKKKNQRRIRLP